MWIDCLIKKICFESFKWMMNFVAFNCLNIALIWSWSFVTKFLFCLWIKQKFVIVIINAINIPGFRSWIRSTSLRNEKIPWIELKLFWWTESDWKFARHSEESLIPMTIARDSFWLMNCWIEEYDRSGYLKQMIKLIEHVQAHSFLTKMS